MNLLFLGDINSNFKKVNDFLEKRPYIDDVFQTGNLGFSKSLLYLNKNKRDPKLIEPISKKNKVYFCKGANDDYKYLGSKVERRYNIFALENSEIFEKDDLKIGVLGGIYDSRFYEKPCNKIFYDKNIRKDEVDRLLTTLNNIDILLTHMGPAGFVPTGWGSDIVLKLVKELKPKFLIHGHHKINYKANYKDTEIIGLGDFSNFDKSYKILTI